MLQFFVRFAVNFLIEMLQGFHYTIQYTFFHHIALLSVGMMIR